MMTNMMMTKKMMTKVRGFRVGRIRADNNAGNDNDDNDGDDDDDKVVIFAVFAFLLIRARVIIARYSSAVEIARSLLHNCKYAP